MRRIGIDVGGTNTDAVLIQDDSVVAGVKTPTTEDVTGGILNALKDLVSGMDEGPRQIDAVMIGTTHFTNAVIQRRDLKPVAAVRIGLPASASLPPFVDWPNDLARIVRGRVFMIEGGHEYDGRPLVDFDADEMRKAAREIADSGITSVGIASVFSPLTAECEEAAGEIVRQECPGVDITLSHDLGRIGLLERENATLLNACIIDLARKTTRAFTRALGQSGIQAPLYMTQNDGTVMQAEFAAEFPIYSFASGPTNSMRGAAFLTGLNDGIVIDVGGTTTDVGVLQAGFPREANNVVEIGGVRTLFRMPDLLSVGLGGGSVVQAGGSSIGPISVGHRITTEALVFGGDTLTATDVASAAGLIKLGDTTAVESLEPSVQDAAMSRIAEMVDEAVDRMKVDANPVPLIAVGGAAFLVPDQLSGISEVIQVEHRGVANAVGAAIAQVSGEVDQVFTDMGRTASIEAATELAKKRTILAGADSETLSVVEVEDLPLSYVPGDALRVRVRVVGDTAPN
jgi:N-methylhydantoinase A/oxoprolinase/acetone carboxylase beta subunit